MPIRKVGKRYEVDCSLGGFRARRTTHPGATRGQAKELERQIYKELHDRRAGKAPSRKLAAAVSKWLDGEAKELRSYRKLLSHALALTPYIGERLLTEAPEVAEEAAHAMRAQGLTPSTVNRRLAILRRVCRLAYRSWRWLDTPIGDRIVMLPENSTRHIYLTTTEVERLAKACPNGYAGDLVRLAAYTGVRRSELFQLTNKCLADNMLWVRGDKTFRPRRVPVPRPLLKMCDALPLPVTDGQLRASWNKARVRTELKHVRFHDLRHTYISWLVQAGIHLRVVQELAGHATLTMTQRYAHLAPDSADAAINALEVMAAGMK